MATDLKQQVKDVIISHDAKEALRLIKILDNQISDQSGFSESKVEQLQKIQARISTIALHRLSVDRIENYLKLYPLQMIEGYDIEFIVSRFRFRLLNELIVDYRDVLRDIFLSSLEVSVQELGRIDISLGGEGVPPSVQNWIKDYVSYIGNDIASSLQIAQYFSNTPNARRLPEDERNKLKKLLNLYEFLKLSSTTIEGTEGQHIMVDKNDRVKIVFDGEMSSVFSEERLKEFERRAANGLISNDLLIDLKTQFPDRFSKYNVSVKNLRSTGNDSVIDVANSYFANMIQKYGTVKMIEPVDQQSSTLIARSLSQMLDTPEHDKDQINQIKQKLLLIIKDKDLFSEFVKESRVQDLLIENLNEVVDPKDISVIKQSPASPIAFQALLRIIFEKKLGLSEEESAWHSFDLVQHFPVTLPEFKTLVAYDVSNNKLTWRYE